MRVFVACLFAIFSPAWVSAAEDVALPNLVEGPRLVAINSDGVAGVNSAARGTLATIYDSFTGAATLTTTTGSPRTYISDPVTVATGPAVQIDEATVFLAATANQTYSNGLVIRIQFWDDFNGASATAIFSNPVGGVQTFTVPGPVTLTANTFTQINVVFAAPIVLNGQTVGVSINYQGDNGAGPVSVDNLTNLLRAQAEPGSGTLAVGSFQANGTYTGPDWGFYRNVGNQTNFNHPNSDRRTFTGLDDIGMALQLRGPVDVAPVVAVAPTTLTGGTGSVTPTITTPAQGTGSTQFACSIPATAPSNFTITSNASQTVTSTTAAIGLTCVPQAAVTTATLTCTQTATPGPNPADATALITCPMVSDVAPTLTYSPSTAAGVTFPAGTAGVANATIDITSAGAVGAGQSAVTGCAITGPDQASFGAVTTTPANGIFNSATTTGSIDLSCTRGPTVANASLTCTETATPTVAGSPFTRTWALTCPAATPVAPVAAVAATTLVAGSGSVTPTITTPAQGGGSTQFACSIPLTAPSNFTITSNASQTITTTTAAIGLTCVPQAAVTTATLTCTQTATPGPNPADATALITCPALPSADLSITKTDGVTSVTAGGSTTYTLVTSNAGPSTATGATVTDTFPAGLTCTWTCSGAGGGTCTASGSGNISDTVNLPAGGSVTHLAACTISASATGSLANTATVAAPAGVTDPTPGNNAATDTDTVTGTGVLGVLSSTVNFGIVAPPGSSTGTMTLTNTGTAPLQVTGLTDAMAPFAATGGTCGPLPITINAGASCTVIYTFTPGQQQAASQTITVTSDAGTVTVTLQGAGASTSIPTLGALSQMLLLLLIGGVAWLTLRRH
jgi:uncharacterized repeat protein (TIGR01451 family)